MGILNDVSQYMSVVTFGDDTNIDRQYYEVTYSNVDKHLQTFLYNVTEYSALYPEGGLFRNGSFAEAHTPTRIEVFFEPVTPGTAWRGVVKDKFGVVICSSPWRIISTQGLHDFDFDVRSEVAANTEVFYGVEPQVASNTAKAFYNNRSNDSMPFDSGFATDNGTYYQVAPPNTFGGQTLIISDSSGGNIQRRDPATGATIDWSLTGLGLVESVAVSPDGTKVAYADNTNVVLLDAEDGSEVWTYAHGLGTVDHFGGLSFSADGTKLLVSSEGSNAVVLDLSAATPPGVFWSSSVMGNYSKMDPSDNTHAYLQGADTQIIHKVNYVTDSIEWSYDATATAFQVTADENYVYVAISSRITKLDKSTGLEVFDKVVSTSPDSDGDIVVLNEVAYYIDINGDVQRIDTTDPNATEEVYYNSSNIAHLYTDGRYLYSGRWNDAAIQQIDTANLTRSNTQVEWNIVGGGLSTLNGVEYSGRGIPSPAVTYEPFTQLTTDSLAMKLVRQVEDDFIQPGGYAQPHHVWPSYIEVAALGLNVKAITPIMETENGANDQMALQYSTDNGVTWHDATLGKRNKLSSASPTFRAKFSPPDWHEDWSAEWWDDTAAYTLNAMTDLRTSVSRNELSDMAADNFQVYIVTSEVQWGNYAYPYSNSYDADSGYYLFAKDSDASGDFWVESRVYTDSSYYNCWAFGGNDRISSWEFYMRGDGYYFIKNPYSKSTAASGNFTDMGSNDTHRHIQLIRKNDTLHVVSDGTHVGTVPVDVPDQVEDPKFGFSSSYYSTYTHWHDMIGHGMARGHTDPQIDGRDLVKVDAFSVYLENAS